MRRPIIILLVAALLLACLAGVAFADEKVLGWRGIPAAERLGQRLGDLNGADCSTSAEIEREIITITIICTRGY